MTNKKTENTINEYHLNRHQPDKPQFAVHDLGDYLTRHQAHTEKPHIHSYYQIIWFKNGTGKHFVDFKSYDIRTNTIFFIAKNQIHYFDNCTNYEGILLHFNEAFLVHKESETDFFLKCNLFNSHFHQPYSSIENEVNNILNEYISQIKVEFGHSDEFGKEELLRAYLKSFLIQIQRTKKENTESQDNKSFVLDEKRILLIKFINLLDENYTKGLSVSEYSRLLVVSTRTLSNLTHQLLNKTPLQMIQERVILEAQRLLIHSELNVNQIGYRLGFDDPSYFVKYFKKHTDISPSEFRKSIS
jgi:AraC family transcriptional activator of pobA